MTIPRSNHEMAAIVDQGILLAEQSGYSDGYLFMRENNVPVDVALRVLAFPDQRRNY
ncbi:MAG: hypothetical protein HGA75_03685 [Thiobacillus sp.]|nr:hypothetical protein [Thiobacillus sp.]